MEKRFFRMLEVGGQKSAMIETPEHELHAWNERGYGIFHALQVFRHDRKKESLLKIRLWAIDLDAGTKESQINSLRQGLPPSLIIETQRGHHAYWFAKDATLEYFSSIMDQLTTFYNADKNAQDVSSVSNH